MSFERFERPKSLGRRPGPGKVTIGKNQRIFVNKSALSDMGTPRKVSLLFDPQRNIAALEPVEDDLPNTRLVSPGGVVSATGFPAHIGLPSGQAMKFSTFMEDGLLCFDPKAPISD